MMDRKSSTPDTPAAERLNFCTRYLEPPKTCVSPLKPQRNGMLKDGVQSKAEKVEEDVQHQANSLEGTHHAQASIQQHETQKRASHSFLDDDLEALFQGDDVQAQLDHRTKGCIQKSSNEKRCLGRYAVPPQSDTRGRSHPISQASPPKKIQGSFPRCKGGNAHDQNFRERVRRVGNRSRVCRTESRKRVHNRKRVHRTGNKKKGVKSRRLDKNAKNRE